MIRCNRGITEKQIDADESKIPLQPHGEQWRQTAGQKTYSKTQVSKVYIQRLRTSTPCTHKLCYQRNWGLHNSVYLECPAIFLFLWLWSCLCLSTKVRFNIEYDPKETHRSLHLRPRLNPHSQRHQHTSYHKYTLLSDGCYNYPHEIKNLLEKGLDPKLGQTFSPCPCNNPVTRKKGSSLENNEDMSGAGMLSLFISACLPILLSSFSHCQNSRSNT